MGRKLFLAVGTSWMKVSVVPVFFKATLIPDLPRPFQKFIHLYSCCGRRACWPRCPFYKSSCLGQPGFQATHHGWLIPRAPCLGRHRSACYGISQSRYYMQRQSRGVPVHSVVADWVTDLSWRPQRLLLWPQNNWKKLQKEAVLLKRKYLYLWQISNNEDSFNNDKLFG